MKQWLVVAASLVVGAAGAILTAALIVTGAVLAVTVAVPLVLVAAVYAGCRQLVDRLLPERTPDLGDVLGYRGWSGRLEDLPTIPDEQRNTRAGGGR